MSQEIDIARLQAEFERLQQDYNATLEALQEQMDLVGQLTEKVQALEPEAARAPELLQQLRGLKHKGAFQEIAEKLGVRKEALDDLWKLGEWKAEDDEPDPKKMEEHFSEIVKARDYLKADGDKPRKLPADENGNRGPFQNKGEGKIKLNRQQLNDPEFMDRMMGEIAKDPGALELV